MNEKAEIPQQSRLNPPDLPVVATDGTGWTTVSASPAWWRAAGQDAAWTGVAEQIAALGEGSVRSALCRVTTATTGRPCRHNTAVHGPCPHHGPDHEAGRCGAATKSGAPCRWNLVVHGACPNHPESWESIVQAREQQERLAAAAREQEQRRLEEQLAEQYAETLLLPCSYCAASPGDRCISPGSGQVSAKLHTPRVKLRAHHADAAAAACTGCDAAVGELCRTSTGRPAVESHAPRRRAAELAVDTR
ncbi:zinc finger domain-containing protein [Streptomyces sp. H39-C1]|uniref:zinc finger domain-containing protein n=1 Tax=Streptomyces sp. H39-C1 TaxID=3004355 RepID=UPI0022AF673D|nr:hypothetical protein [Streptomyces sp. H39-C1]MCZ4098002.1 hypothetical protein [Streptomyces sp. H39-C1]